MVKAVDARRIMWHYTAKCLASNLCTNRAGAESHPISLSLDHTGLLIALNLLATLNPNANSAVATAIQATIPVQLRRKLEAAAAVSPEHTLPRKLLGPG